MPHLLRFSHDLEARLDRLSRQTGWRKAYVIERCLADGLSELERHLLLETPNIGHIDRPIDQLLRESGLGA